MDGTRLAHYEIIEPLGRGGMGEVWLAEDTRLGRQVALKLLPPELADDAERLQRFEREAKTLAAMNHPGIVTIFSVEEADGRRFMTMELIAGKTLSQIIPADGLAIDQFLRLAVPLADAIAAAHERGVHHRDLKPANVMVTDDGRVKVLDFGLAKLREAHAGPEGLTQMRTSDLTSEGRILGTIAYMSPEQAEGLALDHRSDIFSLGILLYEMATGQRPFQGETNLSILSSILKDEPRSVSDVRADTPLPLARIIHRALAKRPDARYQSAVDLRQDLADLKRDVDTGEALASGLYRSTQRASGTPMWRTAAMALGAVVLVGVAILVGVRALRDDSTPLAIETLPARNDFPGVVVFYFDNISGDTELDWLRTGLTDMLVTDLSQAPNLRVLGTDRLQSLLADQGGLDARVTSFDVVSGVARRARMGTAIVGSFAKAGEQVRINARVQDASTGDVLASESVSGGVDEIFTLVEQLTDRIAERFAMPEMSPQMEAMMTEAGMMEKKALADMATHSVEAYRLYIEGETLKQQSRDLEAIPLLRRAVELDPEFALAHAKLSVAYGNSGQPELAEGAARRAFELADRLPPRDRYYVQGRFYSLNPQTVDQAIAAYEKAVELFPDHTAARNNLAINLMGLQRFEEAAAHLELLREQQHEFAGTYFNLAEVYGALDRDQDAVRVLQEFVEREPAIVSARTGLARSLTLAGSLDDALATVDQAIALGGNWEARATRASVLAVLDRWEEARAELDLMAADTDPRAPLQAAIMRTHGMLVFGDLGGALATLDQALADLEQPSVRLAILQDEVKIYQDLGRGDDVLRIAATIREQGLDQQGIDVAAMEMFGHALLGDVEQVRASRDAMVAALAQLPLPEPVRQQIGHELDGLVALARGDAAAAAGELEAALATMLPAIETGNAADLHFWLGEALWQLGRRDEAVEHFEKIVAAPLLLAQTPISTNRARWYLGTYHAERGEMDAARPHLQRFVHYWGDGEIDRERVQAARDLLQ